MHEAPNISIGLMKSIDMYYAKYQSEDDFVLILFLEAFYEGYIECSFNPKTNHEKYFKEAIVYAQEYATRDLIKNLYGI